MSQIDLPRRHHLDAITSERWTASDQNRWTPSVRYDRTASLESARRAEIRHHHHIAGDYLIRYAQEAAWREDSAPGR